MSPERIKVASLLDKVMTAAEAAKLFENGMVVGSSGFTKAGDSKEVLPAFAERAAGEDIKITLMTGASLGHGTDGKLAVAGALTKRMPFQVREGRDFRRPGSVGSARGERQRDGRPDGERQ